MEHMIQKPIPERKVGKAKYARAMYRLREHLDHLEGLGYEVVGIFVQGSQNYGLDIWELDYMSDVDSKAIVLPKFEDFVDGKEPVSTTIILPNNEHIDVKDIRIMFDILKKGNVNFLEILFTDFCLINPKYYSQFLVVQNNAERLAFANMKALLNGIAGMSMQKFVALKHPYPTIIDKIAKYGYDPKQLHHIYRLNQFIKRILNGEMFGSALTAHDRDKLIDIKKGSMSLEMAELNAEKLNEETHKLKEIYIATQKIEIDEDAYNIYKQCKKEILTKWFKEQLKNS